MTAKPTFENIVINMKAKDSPSEVSDGKEKCDF